MLSGKQQKDALAAIQAELRAGLFLGRAGAGKATSCLLLETAIEIAAAALVGVVKKRRTTRAKEAVVGLIEGGYLQQGLDDEEEEWVW